MKSKVSAASKPAGKSAALAVSPRADLLPPEIIEGHKERRARRGMRLLILFTVFVALVATGGAYALELQADSDLAKAEQEAQVLLLEQSKFAEERSTLRGIAEGEAAVRVGGASDIEWAPYIRQLQSLLPADVVLTNVVVESAGILEPYAQSDIPLEQPRIATLVFTAESPVVPSIPSWIESLSQLPGFADASPSSLINQGESYLGTVTMHIDTGAYSLRFVPAEEGAG